MVQALKEEHTTIEQVVLSFSKDMDSRIETYTGVVRNLEGEINRLKKERLELERFEAAGLPSVKRKYAKGGKLKSLYSPRQFKTIEEYEEHIKLHTRELGDLKSLLNAMKTLRKELKSVDIKEIKKAVLPNGEINGLYPEVQRILGIYASFSDVLRNAEAATWKLSVEHAPGSLIAPKRKFTRDEALNLVERGRESLDILERLMVRFTEKGGAERDYLDPSDTKKLLLGFTKIRAYFDRIENAAKQGKLEDAGKLLKTAAKEQRKIDENYYKVMVETETSRYGWEEADAYEFFKIVAAPYIDYAAAAAPFVGAVTGLFGGPGGSAAGAKVGTNVSAAWWAYRGVDGIVTAVKNGHFFSMECAQSIALTFLSATHIPGADKLRWIRPARGAAGIGLMGSMAYHAGMEIMDSRERGWFFTKGQRESFAFYGGIFVFSAASILPKRIAAKKLMGDFRIFRSLAIKGDKAGIAAGKKRWIKLADLVEKAGDVFSSRLIRRVVRDATGEITVEIPGKRRAVPRKTKEPEVPKTKKEKKEEKRKRKEAEARMKCEELLLISEIPKELHEKISNLPEILRMNENEISETLEAFEDKIKIITNSELENRAQMTRHGLNFYEDIRVLLLDSSEIYKRLEVPFPEESPKSLPESELKDIPQTIIHARFSTSDAIKVFEKLGFEYIGRTKEHKLKHPDGRTVILPESNEIKGGTLSSACKQAKITRRAFVETAREIGIITEKKAKTMLGG